MKCRTYLNYCESIYSDLNKNEIHTCLSLAIFLIIDSRNGGAYELSI